MLSDRCLFIFWLTWDQYKKCVSFCIHFDGGTRKIIISCIHLQLICGYRDLFWFSYKLYRLQRGFKWYSNGIYIPRCVHLELKSQLTGGCINTFNGVDVQRLIDIVMVVTQVHL